MKVSLYTDDLRAVATDLIGVGVFSDEPDRSLAFSHLNRGLDGALEQACRDEDFRGKPGQTVVFNVKGGVQSKRIVVHGNGERERYTPESARQFAGNVARIAQRVGARSMALQLSVVDAPAPAQKVLDLVRALAEGAILGGYAYQEYRTKDRRESHLDEVRVALVAEDVQGVKGAALRGALARGQVLAEAVAMARNLVNAPPNVLHPLELADRARRVAKTYDLDYKALGPKDLEKAGMNLHLGVAKGSAHEPRLIHLSYAPAQRSERTVVLVGKGLTFDAGGLSLKTAEGMMEMKVDMGGAAAVLGAMQAIGQLKPSVNVHGIIGAAENMPDGNAIRPGDILRSKKGLTVEVLNTDAEGRLVLADALSYAQDLRPTEIIDLATLTGACMVALGRGTAGAFINDEELAKDLAAAWESSGESFWRMPLLGELREQLVSDVADLKNIGDRYGGAITGALFLREFVEPGVRWAHLDIAGPVLATKDSGHQSKGATGFGVRTLVELVERLRSTVD
ncbi:MAG: leucyl aminopeptidase [Deltaproteobacteria bacterium]|nr:leucyl aminopeptidase [Deltaproteobacteria bacterium]